MMSRKAFYATLLLLACLTTQAKDFDFSALSPSGHTLYYSIIDRASHEVEVVCPSVKYGSGSQRPWDGHIRPFGRVVVPDVVSHEGVDYTVVSIGWNAFYGCYEMRSITLPASLRDFKTTAFEYCRNLEEIVVDAGNPVFDSRGGCNAIIKTKDNELVYGCRGTMIPRTVTSIAWYAFRGSGLQSITIPPSVTYISDQAFYDCQLTEVTIPATVKDMGAGAFDDKVTLKLEGTALQLEKGRYYFDDAYDDEGYAYGVCMVPCGRKREYEQSAWGRYFTFREDCEDYTVTVDDTEGCIVWVSSGLARFGNRVGIACNKEGYTFVIMSGSSPTNIEVKDNSFLMPYYDVIVKAVKQ